MIQHPPLPAENLIAVIHLGASTTRMMIAQAPEKEGGSLVQIDMVERPIPLGRDIFRKAVLERQTIESCAQALTQYRNLLLEYGIQDTHTIRVVATNILAEAKNQDVFFNRIQVACGLEVETLDDGEMTRLIYMSAERILQKKPTLAKKNVLAFHIGPGNTRVLFFQEGRIVDYQNYRLGAIRTREALQSYQVPNSQLQSLAHEHIRGNIAQIRQDFAHYSVDAVIGIGDEIQTATLYWKSGASRHLTANLTLKQLRYRLGELCALSSNQIVRHYQISYDAAEVLIPALESNLSLGKALGATQLVVPTIDFEDALLSDLTRMSLGEGMFRREVIQSAINIGKKYHFDQRHALHVDELCKILFEKLQPIHDLEEDSALLLQVAAILHEIGLFISTRAHHKHSHYLIDNSEVFGLSKRDIHIVALIARYHRGAMPQTNHLGYRDLNREQRMRVSKLAAILRVADALERSHSQRVKELKVEVEKQRLNLIVDGVRDLSIEQVALQQKGDLFRQIFGLDIFLRSLGTESNISYV